MMRTGGDQPVTSLLQSGARANDDEPVEEDGGGRAGADGERYCAVTGE